MLLKTQPAPSMISPSSFPAPSAKSARNATDRAARAAASHQEAEHDAELVRRFNAGDEAAFVEIMTRYREKIFSVALALLRNRADAEEIAQDTFIRAHRGLSRFRGDSSLATWLHRIAVNLARNRYWYFFRRRRQDTLSIDKPVMEGSTQSFAEVLSDGVSDPRKETMHSEFSGLVAAAMERLDRSHREILSMRGTLDLSYEEIAAILGMNVGTVKSRIARAREKLRALLMQAAPEFGREAELADFFESTREAPGHHAGVAFA
jgi:RNA polymerase sigma-70 factor (ECF subfamily)